MKQIKNELEEEDKSIKSKMEPLVRERLANKNLALFEYLLNQTEYPDAYGVMGLMMKGVPIIGCDESPNAFERLVVPATLSEGELRLSSVWIGASKKLKDEDVKAFLETFDEEVARGFLKGPFSEHELSERLGSSDWLLNPRFALFQGGEC